MSCPRTLLLLALTALGFAVGSAALPAQDMAKVPGERPDKFRQLEEILPTPNEYRTASGAPGAKYWQQRADYDIEVTLHDDTQSLSGRERITYYNNSPDTLKYLWVQLEPNIFRPDSDANLTRTAPDFENLSFRRLRGLIGAQSFNGGVTISDVKDLRGRKLDYTIVKTMMRIDLPEPLTPGSTVAFSLAWRYQINNSKVIWARTGYEYFEEDDNYLYEIAHWFPRMAAYTDVTGWQHKQFIGSGEFTLEFGDYKVRITAPSDHVVTATGVLQNEAEVLTSEQRDRLRRAARADKPMFVITPEEAKANEESRATTTKTWEFHAENVRDFAWASSRKFAWDAMGYEVGGQNVMCMSFFPNEGEPLWSRYSTHAIAHTLEVYSRYSFDYPYPVAISVNGPVGGMEYPMICFNGPRPEKDGTYTKRTKYGLISVIIHEVGHFYFPMIVNTDERQWTWMDEGINTFLQFLTEQEWEDNYPSRRGEPRNIVEYMSSDRQVPIMTNSESLLQFGANAYAKPATALNILRETVLGRELFDFAFREYSQRWMFKRPMPADFFRTLEDASAVDLDWFWRGWFYSTDHTDLGIVDLHYYRMETGNPDIDKPAEKEERDARPTTLSEARNRDIAKRTHTFPELKDFYNSFDELDVTLKDREDFEEFYADLEDFEKELLRTHQHFYALELENVGGLVMPVILLIEYENGDREEMRIPAEIWRRDSGQVVKLLLTEHKIATIELDPREETADVDRVNNYYPRRPVKSRFQIFKDKKKKNPMQEAERAAKKTASSSGAEKF